MRWLEKYPGKLITPEQAASLVKSGDVVGFANFEQPVEIAMALARRAGELRNVTLRGFWTEKYPWFEPGMEDSFHVQDYFAFRLTSRRGVQEKWIDWVPWLSGLNSDPNRHAEVPARDTCTLYADVYFCRVTPPNKNGYCSLGRAVWYSPSSIRTAKIAVAQIDPGIIWTNGSLLHVSEFEHLVAPPSQKHEIPHTVSPVPPADEAEKAAVIGSYAASLIKDGDTIEVGTGAASEAVMEFLGTKNDLGLDSEVFYAPMIRMVKSGVFTGAKKNTDNGRHTASTLFLYGGDPQNQEWLDFVDQNYSFFFRDLYQQVNVPRIASNDNMVAVNTALAVDLYGQVVTDHLGPVVLSGPGGQPEYVIGSHYSRGGRSLTCLMSTARGGTVSRIVPQLEPGTMVGFPATYLDYLLTENGIVNLEGKSRRQRAEAIISVADEKFRPELTRAARKLFFP